MEETLARPVLHFSFLLWLRPRPVGRHENERPGSGRGWANGTPRSGAIT